MNSYRLSFRGDATQMIKAMRAAGRHVYSRPQALLICAWSGFQMLTIALGGAALFVAVRSFMGLSLLPQQSLFIVVAAVASGLGLAAFQWWVYKPLARAAARGAMGCDVIAELSPCGLRWQGGQSNWFTAWADIDAITHEKGGLCLIVGAIVFYLPHDAIAAAGDLDVVISDLERWHASARAAKGAPE